MTKKIVIITILIITFVIIVIIYFYPKKPTTTPIDHIVNTPVEIDDCTSEGEYMDTPDRDSFKCCSDFIKVLVSSPMDENCNPIISDGSPGHEPGWTCLACGDGICNNKHENKCNCPDDCE